VLGWDVERMKPLILGPVNSTITMSFQRVGNQVRSLFSLSLSLSLSRALSLLSAPPPPHHTPLVPPLLSHTLRTEFRSSPLRDHVGGAVL
jgi:hypothetical protein